MGLSNKDAMNTNQHLMHSRAELIEVLELVDHYLAWGKVTEARELITTKLEELYDAQSNPR